MTQQNIWDSAYSNGRDYLLLQPQQIEAFLNFIEKPYESKKILDLGCGTGDLTRKLHSYNFTNIIGADSSKVAISTAKSRNTKDAIDYIDIDLESLFSRKLNTKFDVIICKDTLAFITEKDMFYEQVKKCMKDDGVFIIISPLRSITTPNKAHITLEPKSTQKQLKKHFDLESFYTDSLEEYYICRNLDT